MRLPVEKSARRPGSHSGLRLTRLLVATSLAGSLSACGMLGGGAGGNDRPVVVSAAGLPSNGPQSDYPVEVGDPYQVGTVTYRPLDTMNSDEVGYAALDEVGQGFTGAHHTLPVPSYVEVTSLTNGRTILVRLERRGPMTSNHVVALSPATLAQLDATGDTAVRVRRVNPPEEQRAMLRAGNSAPARMDTPMSLVTVLRRRLPAEGAPVTAPQPVMAAREPLSLPPAASPEPVLAPVSVAAVDPTPELDPVAVPVAVAMPVPAPIPVRSGPPALPPLASASPTATAPTPVTAAVRVNSPAPEPVRVAAPAPAASGNDFVVQAAAFSTEDRARRAANVIGGTVSRSGSVFRVRTGPFASRAAAEASLANVRAAGYSDARIFSGG